MPGTKKRQQQLKRNGKETAARQAADNRQVWKHNSNSKVEAAPKPDTRALRQQLLEAEEQAAAATAEVALQQQQAQQQQQQHDVAAKQQQLEEQQAESARVYSELYNEFLAATAAPFDQLQQGIQVAAEKVISLASNEEQLHAFMAATEENLAALQCEHEKQLLATIEAAEAEAQQQVAQLQRQLAHMEEAAAAKAAAAAQDVLKQKQRLEAAQAELRKLHKQFGSKTTKNLSILRRYHCCAHNHRRAARAGWGMMQPGPAPASQSPAPEEDIFVHAQVSQGSCGAMEVD
ncbi:hypothetical protein DUNSADRAFT_11139 [Dunaliella salina]|uniref:Uncharacterized protein n=1 Tax=Dunaliella salina TaxID=3046 RepID=A0ABQ7GE01_DUNSA|nr:hypothetical protein DUNSADRAFT_11139 [Dunaliella salina]|eukprot:KAF5832838.1 hypothetical protein DUNSADRAFT_11139 [Dunaliella salina]